ncbi:MAG: sigma-70 family RNA polymerase sigma factor [Oscillospiraceae bacterium]|nr:sigma-70 family RNA polymerase sigma factor [Oscillospiraceae bacterium]
MKKESEGKTPAAEKLYVLVEKAKRGDEAAFSELYTMTSANLYRSIRAMTRDEELAWDIQQDTYLRAFRSLDTLKSNEAFFPWLQRIAANVTAKRMSKRIPIPFSELSDEDEAQMELPDLSIDTQPELALDRKETSRLVQEILFRLPEEQQMILGMRYYDELSTREIAELLGISDGTVRAQLFHGRKKVEAAVRELERQGVKLYGLSPLGFLMALLRQTEPINPARQAAMKIVVTRASVSAAGKAIPTVSAQTLGQTLLHGLVGKALIGVLSAALVCGGVWAGSKLLSRSQPVIPDQPSETTEAIRLEQTDRTEAPSVLLESERPETTEAENTTESVESTEPEEPTEPSESAASADVISGYCGDRLLWFFHPDTGALVIEGRDAMDNYLNESDVPWHPYRASITSVSLPEELTALCTYAFKDCTKLTEITLPSKIKCIEPRAFSNCTGLKELILPDSLTSIGGAAFENCSSLTELTIPAAVEEIYYPFSGCASLQAIHVSEENPTFSSVDGVVYNKEKTELALYPCGRKGAFQVPDGITLIGDGAAWECIGLTEITLPATVTSIGSSAFNGCTNLKSVTLPEGLEEIGCYTFRGCAALKQINIPENVSEIGWYAFEDCTALTEIVLPKKLSCLDDDTFSGCTGLTKVTFPAGLTQINADVFRGCSALKEVVLPAGLEMLWMTAFRDCINLKAFSISEENLNYCCDAEGVLYNKEKTELCLYPCGREGAYEIPDGVETIGNCAFRWSQHLKEITLPESVSSVLYNAFLDCDNLTRIEFRNPDCELYYEQSMFGSEESMYRTNQPTIYGYPGSTAEQYAQEHGVSFRSLAENP